MSVSGIGTTSTAPTTFAATVNTPAVQIAQARAATASALFSTVSGTRATTDVSAFTPTAAAYSLFLNPALLIQLQKWDGSATPASQRPAPSAPTPPQFSFNPFDQSSWYGDSTGNTLDATA